MRKRKGEWWRARGLPLKIARGQATLKTLGILSHYAMNCSLTYLLSGGRFDAINNIPLEQTIERSIMHAGKDKHDVARMMGYQNYSYIRHLIVTDTMKLSTLIKLCKAIDRQPWEVVCDGEYTIAEDPNAEPSYWDRMVELNLMGWLDAPKRETR